MGLPDAYDTVLGERGFSLSGGQRQRIAIARAILADPRVLVLDDATSAVDPSKEHEIRAAMATVMEGRTTIVIAHRPGTIALADTVVLLDGGRVVASGTAPAAARRRAAIPRRARGHGGRAERRTVGSRRARDRRGDRLMFRMGGVTEEDKLDAETTKKVLRRTWSMAVAVPADDLVGVSRSPRSRPLGLVVGPLLVRYGIDHGIDASDSGVLRNAVIAYLVRRRRWRTSRRGASTS